MPFSNDEVTACRRLIALALEEDFGQQGDVRGDITSQAVIPADRRGQAVFVARADGVLAGIPAAALVAEALDSRLTLTPLAEEGARVERGLRLAQIAGPMRSILAVERTALNFLQHLSGIATLTRRFVDAVAGARAKIFDTRKTIP